MLFRPTLDQNLVAVHAVLDGWNYEADRFRWAARAATNGDAPTSLTVAAAEEAYEALSTLILEIDEALARAAPGSEQFLNLLHVQQTATALIESIGKSCEALSEGAAVQIRAPTHLGHKSIL